MAFLARKRPLQLESVAVEEKDKEGTGNQDSVLDSSLKPRPGPPVKRNRYTLSLPEVNSNACYSLLISTSCEYSRSSRAKIIIENFFRSHGEAIWKL